MQKQNYEVFISGLPYDSKEEEVEQFFIGCGKILFLTKINKIIQRKINLPKYHDSGRLRGYGHVIFKTKKGLTKALEKNQQHLGSRYITVEVAKPIQQSTEELEIQNKSIPESCNTIYVKGIPYQYTEDEIGEYFMNCGEIENVRIVYQDAQKQKSKGFCYVEFTDHSSVANAIKLNGSEMDGRKIYVV